MEECKKDIININEKYNSIIQTVENHNNKISLELANLKTSHAKLCSE